MVAASATLAAGCILDLESLTQGSGEGGGGEGGSGGSGGSGGTGGGSGGFGPCGAGCSEPCLVTDGIVPYALAIEGSYLYASSMEGGFIGRVALPGGAFEKFIIQTDTPTAIAIAAGHLVWVDANGVWTCPLDSKDCLADRAQLYKTQPQGTVRIRGLAADAQDAYFAEDETQASAAGRILRCNVAAGCGLMPQVIATNQSNPSGVTLSADAVFWTQRAWDWQFGRVTRVPKAGGMPEDIAAGLDFPGSIALSGDQVLWTEETEGEAHPGGVFRCLANAVNCTPEVVANPLGQPDSARIDDPIGVLSDGTQVFFANLGAGSLMACEFPSCTARPKVLFAGMDAPRGTALAHACVYVTDRSSSGRVIAVPK